MAHKLSAQGKRTWHASPARKPIGQALRRSSTHKPNAQARVIFLHFLLKYRCVPKIGFSAYISIDIFIDISIDILIVTLIDILLDMSIGIVIDISIDILIDTLIDIFF